MVSYAQRIIFIGMSPILILSRFVKLVDNILKLNIELNRELSPFNTPQVSVANRY